MGRYVGYRMLTRKLDNMTNGMLSGPINVMNLESYGKVDFMFSLMLHKIPMLSRNYLITGWA